MYLVKHYTILLKVILLLVKLREPLVFLERWHSKFKETIVARQKNVLKILKKSIWSDIILIIKLVSRRVSVRYPKYNELAPNLTNYLTNGRYEE